MLPVSPVIFRSEKRKNVLFLLLEGPKDINTIKKTLNANATSVQPQVKMLREKHLVVQDKDLYRLSKIGKIIVEKVNYPCWILFRYWKKM